MEGPVWPSMLVLGFTLLFTNHLFFTTRYTIEGHTLTIKSGFVYYNSIDISRIREITPSRSFLGAPAASLDRLKIHYDRWDSVLVSPDDKEAFMGQLKEINPEIIVNYGV
ncbi:MAG: PH domain-containing protein [Leadbetterella sp.]|nr:PH domain-containing protein [Leadbetterella sp.]